MQDDIRKRDAIGVR